MKKLKVECIYQNIWLYSLTVHLYIYDVKIIVSGFSTCKYINDINKTESSPWGYDLLCIIP